MKITLKNGSSFTAILNGNNYITTQDVSGLDFSNANLIRISIENDEGVSTVFYNMKVTNQWIAVDGTHIIFHQRSAQEIADEKTKANIDYIAMMTEVDLDE